MNPTWMKYSFDSDLPEWIRTLKVGDVVCNCRCEHKPIVRIVPEVSVLPLPGWLYWVIDRLPSRWANRFDDWLRDKMDDWEMVHITDLQLFFADGSTYYAKPCCSPGDHEPVGDWQCQS